MIMRMTCRAHFLPWLFFAAAAAAACASGQGTPRPQPFPGARTPAASSPGPTTGASSDAARTQPALIATALEQRGRPYRNGGSEPSRGFDCSGLVQWVFARHGTRLPREVSQQWDEGRRIDADEVQPGDLVFFATVGRVASHVGIALGGGEFVHAPSSRGVVRVEGYTSGYWATRWVGARRVGIAGGTEAD